MKRLLALIDHLANRWLEWRTDQAIVNDPELRRIAQEVELKRAEATGPNGWEALRVTPADGEAVATKAARLERELCQLRLLFMEFFDYDDRGKWYFDSMPDVAWYPGDELQKEIKALLD
jgi:hypothetical protein